MRAFDREIDALNYRCPDDQSVRPLHYATPELARELKIPNMEKPGTFLWPPPTPGFARAARREPHRSFHHRRGGQRHLPDARYKRALEDNRRQIAEAEQRQREFEEAKGRRG